MGNRDEHIQVAVEEGAGWWHIECVCGARADSRPSNYEAWQQPVDHQQTGT